MFPQSEREFPAPQGSPSEAREATIRAAISRASRSVPAVLKWQQSST